MTAEGLIDPIETIDEAARLVRESKRIVYLTGGLSRTTGPVDEEPRRRADGHDPALPLEQRGPGAIVAEPAQERDDQRRRAERWSCGIGDA